MQADTRASIQAFVDSAVDAFELAGPICQLGFCPGGDSGPWARLRRRHPPGGHAGDGWQQAAEIGRLSLGDGAVRTVLCVDALGYAFEPRRMVAEIMRILAPGGTLLLCASEAIPQADQGPAYWRLTPRGLERLLWGMDARLVGWQGGENQPHTLYGVGFKAPLSRAMVSGTRRFLERFPARVDRLAGQAGRWRRLKEMLTRWSGRWLPGRAGRDYYKLEFAIQFSVDQDLKYELLQTSLPGAQTGTRLDLTE